MADIRIPQEIISWIQMRNWGEHHDEWHTVRRWDLYHFLANLAQNGETRFNWAIDVVNKIQTNNWQRAPIQEGERGNGLSFLAMHRAMLLLLVDAFPQHANIFEGWITPPTDPNDPNDPVDNGAPFDPNMLTAIDRIENQPASFTSEEDFGLYLETNLRQTPQAPYNQSSDASTGLHNYLHGRWTDPNSPINLGDPTVNIFNARFWALHGWIDRIWTRYRGFHNLPEDQAYLDLIEQNKQMMNMHHHTMPHAMLVTTTNLDSININSSQSLSNAFATDFGL